MVGFAVVLDCELPIALRCETQGEISTAGLQLRPAIGTEQLLGTPQQLACVQTEVRRVTAQVDEQDTHEDGAAHRLQSMVRVLESFAVVQIHAADVRRGLEVTVGRVRQAVIAAGNQASNFRRLGDQLYTAMNADVGKKEESSMPIAGDGT